MVANRQVVWKKREDQKNAEQQWDQGNHTEGHGLEPQVHKIQGDQRHLGQCETHQQDIDHNLVQRKVYGTYLNDRQADKPPEHREIIRFFSMRRRCSSHPLHQIDKGENQDPNEIHEVPVKPSDFNLVMVLS